jgi:hypothetical protein
MQAGRGRFVFPGGGRRVSLLVTVLVSVAGVPPTLARHGISGECFVRRRLLETEFRGGAFPNGSLGTRSSCYGIACFRGVSVCARPWSVSPKAWHHISARSCRNQREVPRSESGASGCGGTFSPVETSVRYPGASPGHPDAGGVLSCRNQREAPRSKSGASGCGGGQVTESDTG